MLSEFSALSPGTVERPRERLLRQGSDGLSDVELLEVLITPGSPGAGARELARQLLDEYRSLACLATRHPRELATKTGLGIAKAARIHAALSLARRLRGQATNGLPLSTPERVYERYAHWVDEPCEVALAIALDNRLNVLGERVVGRGTSSRCELSPREVFLACVRDGGMRLIFLHTHPSGDSTPSVEDLAFTSRLVRAGQLLGVPLIDHVILGRGSFVSLAQQGLIGATPRTDEAAP